MADKKDRAEEFVKLLTSNQSRIYAYILSFVINHNDADDIMQETSSTMWKKFEQFEAGTDFLAWGATIAYYKVLEYRKKRARDRKVQFCDEIFEQINICSADSCKDADLFFNELRACISNMPEVDVELVKKKYWEGLSVADISKRTGKTARAIYYNLGRIHKLLARCVKRGVK